jgi:glycosyltransferase involved in cell wall biosynthesis
MKTAIIVSSVNRPEILHDTIVAMARQTISPVVTVLSLCDTNSVREETLWLPLVRVVQGSKGLTRQRNNGLQALPREVEYVLFMDDDIELAPNYLESMERLFDETARVVLASGVSAKDGLREARTLSREEAVAAVQQYRVENRIETAEGAYGCNMFVRRSLLETMRFDERLLLDGWLEDYDFSTRCRLKGDVVWNFGTCVAHLGAQRIGRERGFLVGYSQIANPFYLWQKGVIPSFFRLLKTFWLPALRVSLQGTLHSRPPWNVLFDYKGRMRGNMRALVDASCFRLRPERILDFI